MEGDIIFINKLIIFICSKQNYVFLPCNMEGQIKTLITFLIQMKNGQEKMETGQQEMMMNMTIYSTKNSRTTEDGSESR